MVISNHVARPAIDAADLSFNNTASKTASNTASGGAVNSFAQQLMTTIEGYLNKSGSGSNLEVNIQAAPGQNSGGSSQFVVTVKNLTGGTAATASPAAPAEAASTRVSTPLSPTLTVVPPFVALAPAPAPAPVAAPAPSVAATAPVVTAAAVTAAATLPAGAVSATPSSKAVAAAVPGATVDKSNMTPDQAYWAEQPPAVQALQTTPDDQKVALAQQLASQGYSIDVPIMVWNWDPLATMVQRQIDGYTWVPSLQQAATPVAPGVDFPGAPSYDPTKPPPGSIAVTTAFAQGTNGQNSWIKNVDTTTGDVAIT